jgi:ATP synthase protein I
LTLTLLTTAAAGGLPGLPPVAAVADKPPKRPLGTPPAFFNRNNLRRLELSAMGLYLLVAIAVGLAIGYYLDRWLGTSPWFLAIFLIAGVISGFRNMYQLLRREMELARKEEDDG